ncbi:SIR2 family protein [Lysobacter enzymogenes]|uniref:SIR2 family protein n=1 Tax=Lysobacter enzymogenes TaxID=69 RepID=UPI0019D005BA|nr:SIR2 family protein [Lysobacter enzymogenes]
MARNYSQYQEEVAADVAETLKDTGCQPILFVGSGFSRRYASAPTWDALLKDLAERCPLIDREYAYYKQKFKNLPEVASAFAESYREWAWGSGRLDFPDELFNENVPSDAFLKYAAAQSLRGLGPQSDDESFGSEELDREIVALQAINPHAIVTTNYDELLEPLFPEYERIVGQRILKQPYLAIGEIFKIHGCVSMPESIVLTDEDYAVFDKDKKYLSAKLLTYFAEHPLLFIGYSATDPNIRSVLYDVDRMIRADFDLIPNIYILEWSSDIDESAYPPRDRVLSVGDGREIRIKSISASSFEWVYEAFGSGEPLEKVNMKLLRSLLARTVDLVRKDVPTKRVEIDFETLEHKLSGADGVATLLGVAAIDDPTKVNVQYPYTISEVADQLKLAKGWNAVNKYLQQIEAETGVNLKGFDNSYHIGMRTGRGKASRTNKYSQALVDLIAKVRDGQKYELAKDCLQSGSRKKR